MAVENFYTRYLSGAQFDQVKRVGIKRLFELVCDDTGLDYYQIGLLLDRAVTYGGVKITLFEFSAGFGYSRIRIPNEDDEVSHSEVFARFINSLELGEFDFSETLTIEDEHLSPDNWHVTHANAREILVAANLPVPLLIAERKRPLKVRQTRESTYLNIIGGLCELLWREIRTSEKDINQAEIIRQLEEQLPGTAGLSQRTLKDIIPLAIKSVRSSE